MVLAVGKMAADRTASHATSRTMREIAFIRDDEFGRIILQDYFHIRIRHSTHDQVQIQFYCPRRDI